MESTEQYFECNEPSVIFERFDDETILINLDSGRYYSLDPVGVVVWEMITHPLSIEELLARLKSHYDADESAIESALLDFIEKMKEEQLIRPCRQAPPAATDTTADALLPEARAFAAPVLARYEDMAEMLLLDPVHDVAEAGWPQAPPASVREAAAQVEVDDASRWPGLDEEK